MGFLPIFPAMIAAYVALRSSPARAFVQVYVPVLLLLPMYYRWVIPTLPDPTFEQATILPIAFVFLMREGRYWKFSFGDLLIFCFAAWVGLSEYLNTGYNEAQNLMFDMVASVIFPYMLAKGLIEPHRIGVAFAKKFVTMLVIVSVLSVYEFRMGKTPWIVLRRFYPDQGLEWYTIFRYGLARVAGPYGHAILAGLLLVIALRLQRWLEWSGAWEPHLKGLRWTRLSKSRIIMLVLLGGMMMTLERGPWLGGVVGAALVAVGRTRRRILALTLITATILVVGIPAASAFYAYASVGRAHAKTPTQETVAYRVELIGKYVDKAWMRPVFGYGKNTWPKNPTAPSIDNYYLLLWLMHGLVAVALLLTIMITMTVRLVRHELRKEVSFPPGSSLGFTLAGIFVVYLVTIATVYMGLQTIPVFALIAGWSEGYLIDRRVRMAKPYIEAPPPFAFRRVVA